MKSNNVIGWLVPLLCIQEETPGSLGCYPGWGFLWFSSVSPDMYWDNTLKQGLTTSLHILSSSSFAVSLLFDAV